MYAINRLTALLDFINSFIIRFIRFFYLKLVNVLIIFLIVIIIYIYKYII